MRNYTNLEIPFPILDKFIIDKHTCIQKQNNTWYACKTKIMLTTTEIVN